MRSLSVALFVGSASAARKNLDAAATAPAGYTELPGKCTGRWIENWADGHYAHYGEDHHIDGVDDCADMCDQHPECAGFYVKEGRCSHWRSGHVSATPHAGHTCYVREGGGHSSPTVSDSCDDVAGYDVSPGKCTGHWIENWSDGHSAHYGEDHHISSIEDCADTCDEHSECAGFYTKQGRCSHWRSGSLDANPNPGHCCYSKMSSSLLETGEEEVDAEAEEDTEEGTMMGRMGYGYRRMGMWRMGMHWGGYHHSHHHHHHHGGHYHGPSSIGGYPGGSVRINIR